QNQLQLVEPSPTDLLSKPEESQQQQPKHKRNKKKCRGDRKGQRYRAKLRKRRLNDQQIANLEQNYKNMKHDVDIQSSTIPEIDIVALVPTHTQTDIPENQHALQRKSVKRKRETRPGVITTSLKEKNLEETESNTKPKYLKVPDQVFKNILSKSLADGKSIVETLDTPEKLEFVRIYAHLLNNVFYLKLERDFWEHYQTVCVSEGIWSSPLQKDIAKENNLCRFKFKTKIQLEKHSKLIDIRLKEVENKLNSHLQQLIQNSFDMNQLSSLITAFVRQGQHKLSAEYKQKTLILQCDAIDHRLITTFYNLNPTENQATKDKLQAEEQVAILKQRIYTKRLPASFSILDHSIDNIENMLKQPALNKDKCATLSFRRLKTIAQFKYDMMVLTIATAEETVRTHLSIIANEKKKLIDTSGGQVPLPKPLIQLMNAITARQTNMVQRSQHIIQQKLSVFDDAPVAENIAGATEAIHLLPSSPIVEVASPLPPKHFSYLTNGPKYVPPCQSRFSSGTIDKIILREYNHIIQSFEKGLTKNCISASDQRAKDFFTGIDDLLRRLHTNTLSPKLLARAQYEHRIMKSTQRQIKKSNVIIRITDKSKVFHLGSVQDYHEKALQYMQDTNAYREITSSINPYQQHVQTVLALIDPMLKKGEINRELWKQYMRPNSVTTELAHLYFVPKPHKIGTPLRPIVSSIKAATTGVSHFLDILLRPLFNRVTKDTTFINGIDFVRQLERYRMNGQLLPMTLFVTFDVTNLYTMIPRDGAIFALQKFLRQYGENRRIHGMTIDIIIRLARLVLDTNCFVYEKKYYQQIRGGAMGSPFTLTLANV
ncbi:unnamed protein product, partial [Rotaria sordida]